MVSWNSVEAEIRALEARKKRPYEWRSASGWEAIQFASQEEAEKKVLQDGGSWRKIELSPGWAPHW